MRTDTLSPPSDVQDVLSQINKLMKREGGLRSRDAKLVENALHLLRNSLPEGPPTPTMTLK